VRTSSGTRLSSRRSAGWRRGIWLCLTVCLCTVEAHTPRAAEQAAAPLSRVADDAAWKIFILSEGVGTATDAIVVSRLGQRFGTSDSEGWSFVQASRSYLLEVQRIDQDLASAAAALFPSGVTRVDSSGQPRAVVRLPRGVKSFKAALAGTGLVELGASRRAASVNAYLHRLRTALSAETFSRLSHWVDTAVRSRISVLDPPDPASPTGAVLDRLKGGAQ